MKRLAVRVALMFAILIATIIGAYYGAREWGQPKIVRWLPASEEAAHVEFIERMRTRFGAIRSESELIEAFSAEGFLVDRELRISTILRRGLPCAFHWSVAWEADASGVVTKMRANKAKTCL